jgi:hypothetical protein
MIWISFQLLHRQVIVTTIIPLVNAGEFNMLFSRKKCVVCSRKCIRSNSFLRVCLKTLPQIAIISCFLKTCFGIILPFVPRFPMPFLFNYMTKFSYSVLILHDPWITSLFWYWIYLVKNIIHEVYEISLYIYIYYIILYYIFFILVMVMKTKWNDV